MSDYEKIEELDKYFTDEVKLKCKLILLDNKRELLRLYNKLKNKQQLLIDYSDDDEAINDAMDDFVIFKKMLPDYHLIRFILDDVAEQLNNQKRGKTKRVNARLTTIINDSRKSGIDGNAKFLTLTFTDEVLNNTTEATRREYVRKFLKCYATNYVANIDYGDETGREHYHAVCNTDYDLTDKWRYGFSNVKRVFPFEEDAQKLSRYISKLSMHAVKHTTQQGIPQPKLIYSR